MTKTIYQADYRRLVDDLRKARVGRKMRQEDVGRRLGVTRHWVAKVEACQTRLDLIQFVRLCRVYRVDASQLVRRLEEDSPDEDESSFYLSDIAIPPAWRCRALGRLHRQQPVYVLTGSRQVPPSSLSRFGQLLILPKTVRRP